MDTFVLYLSEQYDNKKIESLPEYVQSLLDDQAYSKSLVGKDALCFCLRKNADQFTADTSFFVGVDWLISEKVAVYVEPKVNEREQVDFLGMLFQSLDAPENQDHLEGLFYVDFDSPWISIPERHDRLSPILIIQFLKILQRIVRKGLKKSYYRITQNLHSRVKGKVLLAEQVKRNVLKYKLTSTFCNFQELGVNTSENQFLKLVLSFVSSYLAQKQTYFNPKQQEQLQHVLNYCRSAFEHVDTFQQKHQSIVIAKNIFYREYTEALKLGEYILKRFSFNLDKIANNNAITPPFWIDMSKLFELYVFGKLKRIFPEKGAVSYHDNFQGRKQTDILIHAQDYKCVIDCKYKPRYENENPSLADKRQLAGYTRLRSVYDKLGISLDQLVRGIIVYSHQSSAENIDQGQLFRKKIEEYVNFYKLGISLPRLPIV